MSEIEIKKKQEETYTLQMEVVRKEAQIRDNQMIAQIRNIVDQ
jgi:hypothetical protein